jgi:hypothetical protein
VAALQSRIMCAPAEAAGPPPGAGHSRLRLPHLRQSIPRVLAKHAAQTSWQLSWAAFAMTMVQTLCIGMAAVGSVAHLG